jgi:hypothetical protein
MELSTANLQAKAFSNYGASRKLSSHYRILDLQGEAKMDLGGS